MVFETFFSRLVTALSNSATNFLVGLADLLIVVLFLILGWIVALFLVSILQGFLRGIALERELKKRGIHDALFGFSLTDVLSKVLKLLTLAAFLGIAAEVTNLVFLGEIVRWFVGYVPLLVQGIAVMLLALLAGDYLTDTIRSSGVPFRNLIAWILEAFVVYTGIVIALPLVLPNADVSILRTVFILLLGAVAVAFGLGLAIAIGLGMKDSIARVAKKKEGDLEKLV